METKKDGKAKRSPDFSHKLYVNCMQNYFFKNFCVLTLPSFMVAFIR